MEIRDLFVKETKRLIPLKESKHTVEITPELIKKWAIEICDSVGLEDESISSGGGA